MAAGCTQVNIAASNNVEVLSQKFVSESVFPENYSMSA